MLDWRSGKMGAGNKENRQQAASLRVNYGKISQWQKFGNMRGEEKRNMIKTNS